MTLVIHARPHRDFVAELFAKLLDGRDGVIQAWTTRLMTIRKPVAQRRVLLNAFFDNPIRFGNYGAEIRKRCVQHGVLRHHVEQTRRIAHTWLRKGIQVLLQSSQTLERSLVACRVATPANLVFYGDRGNDRISRCLLACAQYDFLAVAIQMNLAFDHADARTLRAGVHGERRTCY